jgi:Astacin (Peptidase family M12A)
MGFLRTEGRWPGRKIPYEVADDILVDDMARKAVFDAIQEWNTKTEFRFTARTEDEADYSVFRKDDKSCQSPVGKRGGRQFISCAQPFTAGRIMHEMGHCAGFYHEHQRPDRDLFATVTQTAIDNEPQNFKIEADGYIATSYDCGSIMHYGPMVGKISSSDPACAAIMGQRNALSAFDISAANGWIELDNNGMSDEIAVDGFALYQRHKDGRIWRYTGPPLTGWEELDNNPATRSIAASGGNLYQLHSTGQIWRYTGPPLTGWEELDNNPATAQIAAAGGMLFQRHSDGRIWQYTGPPFTGWEEIDNNPSTTTIRTGGGALYQIHTSGRIWRYTGPALTGWQPFPLTGHTDLSRFAPAGLPWWPLSWPELYQLHNSGRILAFSRIG